MRLYREDAQGETCCRDLVPSSGLGSAITCRLPAFCSLDHIITGDTHMSTGRQQSASLLHYVLTSQTWGLERIFACGLLWAIATP